MDQATENLTDAAVDGLLNDFAKWGGIRLDDDHHELKAMATKYKAMKEALQGMQVWHESLKKEQEDKTMHGLKEAYENWQYEWEADKSFDMKRVQEALSLDPLKP